MLGFKSFSSAAVTLTGIEMVHMMRKRQRWFAYNPSPSLKEQFEAIVARNPPSETMPIVLSNICNRTHPRTASIRGHNLEHSMS